jgi:hypothetical protein
MIIRNRIVGAMFRGSILERRTRLIEQNVLFMHPTITSLAKHISTLLRSAVVPEAGPVEQTLGSVRTLIDRYCLSLPIQPRLRPETVLLTGSTGSLGSLLLSQMLVSERVQKIWAVNRVGKGKSIEQRQRESFIDKGIDPGLLTCHAQKVVFVEADLAAHCLGLHDDLYHDVRRTSHWSLLLLTILAFIDMYIHNHNNSQCLAPRLQSICDIIRVEHQGNAECG